MKRDDVPQDHSKSLAGQRKPIYVVDEDGHYTTELSSGWEAEEVVLDLAIEQFETLMNDALKRAQQQQASPLEYHMYRSRMDVAVLSQSTGLFKWRIRRHFNPQVFAKLPDKILARYADAMGIDVTELQTCPREGA
jgi:hypothetical protein